ncbi:MAG: RnfABCDGE type electron transport complex subunit D [Clostridia bacterium]|nr:RnfABCDGE type electron transport complex subunit D [Clostridia bacterium]MBQ4620814.1 RnfABCDGE type electron transport complex subunit D [Clostridia bacterium]
MKLTVASSPHIRGDFRTSRLMLDVVIALLPAVGVALARFGLRALFIILISVSAAVMSELLYCVIMRKRVTIIDASAIVTGLLLALTLPVSAPLWMPAAGSVFAVIFAKLLFGGLGQNIFNPALAGRAFLMLIYPVGITRYAMDVDAVSMSTPLHKMVMPSLPEESILDMFLGFCPGSIGEISALALLIGFAYLLIRKVISWRIPVFVMASAALLSLIFFRAGTPVQWMLYTLFSGGLMLGAIYMATDYATSPVTAKGQMIYGALIGALIVLFRYFGIFPEGVTYAILIANALVWVIDRYTGPRRFGKVKGAKK